jgi:hypothetical protein
MEFGWDTDEYYNSNVAVVLAAVPANVVVVLAFVVVPNAVVVVAAAAAADAMIGAAEICTCFFCCLYDMPIDALKLLIRDTEYPVEMMSKRRERALYRCSRSRRFLIIFTWYSVSRNRSLKDGVPFGPLNKRNGKSWVGTLYFCFGREIIHSA